VPWKAAHHERGQVPGPGQAQVGQVPGAQVDLGRRSGAFADHDVVPGAKVVEGVQDDAQQLLLQVLIRKRVGLRRRPAQHDDLAGPVAAGLEQHRVHRRLRARSGGRRLHRLGPPDLRAAAGGRIDADR
jgi:hypothetical protein